MLIRAALAVLLACSGRSPAPQPPKPDTRTLAAELDAQLGEVAAIIHTHHDDCRRMASELRAVFVRMKVSLGRAREVQKDPELAKQLTTDMRAFDQVSAERVTAIEADFTVDATCARDSVVRDALETMPTL